MACDPLCDDELFSKKSVLEFHVHWGARLSSMHYLYGAFMLREIAGDQGETLTKKLLETCLEANLA